jgi:hypothetical protein
VSDDLDSLFAAPPPEFIEERKRIVAALKDAGRKDEAKAIEKIPRPTLAVWTVNQIARRDPELVRRLGEITERLQVAAGPDYAAAAVEHRHALQQLRERAGEVLADAGHEIAPSIVQRVIANLRAAAGSAETRASLEQGRLARDVEEPEIASLFGTAPEQLQAEESAAGEHAAATAARPGGAAAKASSETSAADRQADERARAKQIAVAEREVKRRRGADAAARKEVTRAEGAVTSARERLAIAEIRAASARAAAEGAARALAEAEADLARTSGN